MPKQNFFAHKTSDVEKGAHIGSGTQIWHFCHIFKGAVIGKDCRIGQNVVVHQTAVIGNNVKIQNNVSVYDGVVLEDHVFCGPSCVFTNIINPRASVPRNSSDFYKKTLVKKNATIGANATIVCGVTIGQHAFIGAGAVVTKHVSNYECVTGVPAKHHGWMSEAGEKLIFRNGTATCPATKEKYKKVKNTVKRVAKP